MMMRERERERERERCIPEFVFLRMFLNSAEKGY